MVKKVIITGACGFIGACLSERFINSGVEVLGMDNLSRNGSEYHAGDLRGDKFTLYRLDISDSQKVFDLFAEIGPVDAVFHLAAQVAVTTSYDKRRVDFMDNAVASFNIIEAVKRYTPDAYCIYASTNKVFGKLNTSQPVGNDFPLNPYTPYGVSKAVGEMYFTEYGRKEIGLRTCCFRQSCIYGHKQFGIEDQGWIAWFTIANILKLPITIYGDGLQIRDLLFVEDLIDLYLLALDKELTGVYTVGGGELNAINLKDSLVLIQNYSRQKFENVVNSDFRPGDQEYFVADLKWVDELKLSWKPSVSVNDGVAIMYDWIEKNVFLIKKIHKM